jgi:hypothetical protein
MKGYLRLTNNLMPKLIKDYQWTGEKRPFNMDKIRRSSERGGFWIMAWEDLGLQRFRLSGQKRMD